MYMETSKLENIENTEALETISSYSPDVGLIVRGGVLVLIAIVMYIFSSSPDEPTLVKEEDGFLANTKEWMRTQVGKLLLWLNMKDGGVYFNYPFQKGVVEKLFDNLTIPQI